MKTKKLTIKEWVDYFALVIALATAVSLVINAYSLFMCAYLGNGTATVSIDEHGEKQIELLFLTIGLLAMGYVTGTQFERRWNILQKDEH